MRPITSKARMYELLAGGALGNTIPQFFSLKEWEGSPEHACCPLWGVRALRLGDKRMRLNVPTADVTPYVKQHFAAVGDVNISPMIDQWCTLKGEVFEPDYPPFGLSAYVSMIGAMPWREALRYYAKTYRGLVAQQILQHHLDPSSYEDVRELLHLYPGHVVEFSACSRNVGKTPGRNTVIWEIRKY